MLTIWLIVMTHPRLPWLVFLTEAWLLERYLPKNVFEMIGRVGFWLPVVALAYLAFLWVIRLPIGISSQLPPPLPVHIKRAGQDDLARAVKRAVSGCEGC
jgi:hypothetical protein